MYIVPTGFFIIFLISTTTGLLFMFKLRKKNKYNVANGTIALGTGIFSLIACIFFLFFSEIWFPSLTNRALYLKIIELRMQLFFLVKRTEQFSATRDDRNTINMEFWGIMILNKFKENQKWKNCFLALSSF